MKLKALLLAALFIVAAVGFVAVDANAQVTPTLSNGFGYKFTQPGKPDVPNAEWPKWTGDFYFTNIFGLNAVKGGATAGVSFMTFGEPTQGNEQSYIDLMLVSCTLGYNFENGVGLTVGRLGTQSYLWAFENAAASLFYMFEIGNPSPNLGMKFAYKGAFVAIMQAKAANVKVADPANMNQPTFFNTKTSSAVDTRMPAVEFGYQVYGPYSYGFNGAVQSILDKTYNPAHLDPLRVNSLYLTGNFGTTFSGLKVDLGGFLSMNGADMGQTSYFGIAMPTAHSLDASGNVVNTMNFGGFATLAYGITPDLRASAGALYVTGSNKDWKNTPYAIYYYALVKYSINPVVSVTPSFASSMGKSGTSALPQTDIVPNYVLQIALGIAI